jgi:hypothetical protein
VTARSRNGEARYQAANRNDQPLGDLDIALRIAIVALALATAYIHSTLGGSLFTLNAVGYLVGATAMVVPIAIARRYRWVVRIGLAGYAATTIAAWAVQPSFYSIAYVAKAIEVALIVLLAIDFARRDGNPIDRFRDEIRSAFPPHGPVSDRA